MKGPSLRLKYDFRRRWECPACHARVRTTGAATSMICTCSQQAGRRNLMQLIFDGEAMLRWREQVPVAAAAAPAAEAIGPEASDPSPDLPAEQCPAAETPQEPTSLPADYSAEERGAEPDSLNTEM